MAKPRGAQGDTVQAKTSKKGPQDLTRPHKRPQRQPGGKPSSYSRPPFLQPHSGPFSPLCPVNLSSGLLPSLHTSYSEPEPPCPETSRLPSSNHNPQACLTTATQIIRSSTVLQGGKGGMGVLPRPAASRQRQDSSCVWQAFTRRQELKSKRGEKMTSAHTHSLSDHLCATWLPLSPIVLRKYFPIEPDREQ